jgi:DnaK suppressor protein
MIDAKLLEICRQKLLTEKANLLNRFHTHLLDFRGRNTETSGDEADQTVSMQAESQMLAAQQRMRRQIFEIESALTRIRDGTYGLCEETEEPIESERLLAVPWTRFSIKGAEIRSGGRYVVN